jgi:putative phage-type endonuclease
MQTINLKQGTQEWHNWRKSRICSSDIAAVMGVSPYLTKRELYYEKKDCWPKGLGKKGNDFIFSKGHEFEAKARAEYSKFSDANFVPVCVEEGAFGASLDGLYEPERRGIEIKYMGDAARKELYVNDELNVHYYYQNQWQIYVAQLDSVDIIAGNDKDIVIQNIPRNKSCIGNLVKQTNDFIECLRTDKMPPMSDRDIYVLEEDEEYQKIYELKENTEMLKQRIEEQEEELKAKISILTKKIPTNCAQYGRIKLLKITRKGNVDYSSIIPAGIDLEKFRKASSSFWKVAINQ